MPIAHPYIRRYATVFDGFYQVIDGILYAHPVLVLLALLAGAQIPNVVRLCGYVARLVSRFLPYR